MESAAGVSAENKAALTSAPARLLSGSLILYLLPSQKIKIKKEYRVNQRIFSSAERPVMPSWDHFHRVERPEDSQAVLPSFHRQFLEIPKNWDLYNTCFLMIHHYTCQQAVHSRFTAPKKTEAASLEVNYPSTHMQESSPGAAPVVPIEPSGQYITMCPCTKAAGTVISAAAMVQQSCGAAQARTACSKAPLPHRASRSQALAEGRVVFSGRQQCWGSRGMQLQQGQGNAGISENKVDEIRAREMKVPKKKEGLLPGTAVFISSHGLPYA